MTVAVGFNDWISSAILDVRHYCNQVCAVHTIVVTYT